MEDCIRILEERRETEMDILLITQVKCHIVGNMLSCPLADEAGEISNTKAPSGILASALLQQLNDIQQRLPAHIQSQSQDTRCSVGTLFRSNV
jgi:hypothetical protein